MQQNFVDILISGLAFLVISVAIAYSLRLAWVWIVEGEAPVWLRRFHAHIKAQGSQEAKQDLWLMARGAFALGGVIRRAVPNGQTTKRWVFLGLTTSGLRLVIFLSRHGSQGVVFFNGHRGRYLRLRSEDRPQTYDIDLHDITTEEWSRLLAGAACEYDSARGQTDDLRSSIGTSVRASF